MGKRFCYTKYPDWLWGTLVERTLSQGHVSGYLVPSSAMVKNTWSCTFTPPYTCMAFPGIMCPSCQNFQPLMEVQCLEEEDCTLPFHNFN